MSQGVLISNLIGCGFFFLATNKVRQQSPHYMVRVIAFGLMMAIIRYEAGLFAK